jgi:isochorismate synthase
MLRIRIFALITQTHMLRYRFPGQDIVSKNGFFQEAQDIVSQSFIITDFNHQSRYVFVESEESFTSSQEQHSPFSISKEAYTEQATKLVSSLQTSTLEKLVYSRVKSAPLTISGTTLFERLEAAYPKAFVYYFKDPVLGEWIGATPEVLIKGTNQSFESMSLAGTKKAQDESPWGAKEIEEQDFVSQFLQQTLVNHGVSDLRSDGPKTVIAGPLAHLRTDFQWKSSLDQAWNIAQDLHPTPAVSGTPRDHALAWIQSEEKHERHFYAGMIGSMDEQSINLYVNLRCAQIQGDQIYLYVGGGFTADSIPEKEWEETENKSRTLLNLL